MISDTAKNNVISPSFLAWKFCGKAQFPHSFGWFVPNYAETVPFHRKLGENTVFFAVRHSIKQNIQNLWFCLWHLHGCQKQLLLDEEMLSYIGVLGTFCGNLYLQFISKLMKMSVSFREVFVFLIRSLVLSLYQNKTLWGLDWW